MSYFLIDSAIHFTTNGIQQIRKSANNDKGVLVVSNPTQLISPESIAWMRNKTSNITFRTARTVDSAQVTQKATFATLDSPLAATYIPLKISKVGTNKYRPE